MSNIEKIGVPTSDEQEETRNNDNPDQVTWEDLGNKAQGSGSPNRTTWDTIKDDADKERDSDQDTWEFELEVEDGSGDSGQAMGENLKDKEYVDSIFGSIRKNVRDMDIRAVEEGNGPLMRGFLQNSEESRIYSRDPGFVTFSVDAEHYNAVRRENVFKALDELVKNGINGDEDKGIFAANQLIIQINGKDSGFSEEDKAKALAIKETPEYRTKKLASDIRNTEKALTGREKDLEECQKAYNAIKEKNKNFVDKFLNRSMINDAKARLEWTQNDVNNLRQSLQKLQIQQDMEAEKAA